MDRFLSFGNKESVGMINLLEEIKKIKSINDHTHVFGTDEGNFDQPGEWPTFYETMQSMFISSICRNIKSRRLPIGR